MSGDCCGCCEQEEGRRKAAEGRIQTMAEDWTTLLTEKEQRRLAASSKYCHGRGLAHACCDELPGFLRSLAASRALMAEMRAWLTSEKLRCWRCGYPVNVGNRPCLVCEGLATTLALAESDMLERLEAK